MSTGLWFPSVKHLKVVAADMLDLPVTFKGNSYVLVVEDSFTKFVNLDARVNPTAQPVTLCLLGDYAHQPTPTNKIRSVCVLNV